MTRPGVRSRRARVGVRIAFLALLLTMLGTSVSAAPQPGQVHFTAAGDWAQTPDTGQVLDVVKTAAPDFNLALGDLSYGTTGQEQAWCDFVTSHVGAGFPFELVSGNHESQGTLNGNINDFSSCLPNQLPGAIGTYGRQYYVDVPAQNPLVRFIMISPSLAFPEGTASYTAGSDRYLWTAQAIDSARSASIPWVVVGMHKPCITVGKYICDPGSDLFNMLVSKKVDLILSGHEHSYQRSNQLSLGAGCTSIVPGSFNAGCVVRHRLLFAQGGGSVAMVVGTGGQALYDVSDTDAEAGYFATSAGANKSPTYGVLDVTATDTTLRANFLTTGGAEHDSFTISRSTGSNTPPVAAFTPTCTNLACSFDGSSSNDPDGTITGYAWNFGDSATATGVQPAHTYAAAGSYPVALTVTDNSGASITTTRNVTVTAAPTTTYASDQFARTVSSGWGTAPTGGSWTLSGGATNFSVANGLGQMKLTAGLGISAYLNSVSAPGTDTRYALSLDKFPTDAYATAYGRRVSGQGAYASKVRINSSGAVSLGLTRLPGTGAEVSIQAAATIPGLTYGLGDVLNVRTQVTGTSPTTIRAKVWKVGTTEPSTWQRSVTDSTAGLQTSGSVGLNSYLSSGAANAPVTVRYDDLSVIPPA